MKRKIRMRRLTNSEYTLIVVLCIIILLLVGFKYMINPQNLKISSLESQKNSLELKKNENNNLIKDKENILYEKKMLLIEKEKIKNGFFRKLDQPHIIYLLNKLLLKSNITTNDINFSEPFLENLDNQDVKKMDVIIPFEGSFFAFNELIKNLKLENKKIVINNINIQKGEKTEITGSIELGIYSLLEDVENSNNYDLKTTNDNKTNPFIPYQKYMVQDEIKKAKSKKMLNELDKNKKEENFLDKDKKKYDIYEAIEGDNISYISMKRYGTEKYVDEILELNNMERSNILPIGKKIKLKRR